MAIDNIYIIVVLLSIFIVSAVIVGLYIPLETTEYHIYDMEGNEIDICTQKYGGTYSEQKFTDCKNYEFHSLANVRVKEVKIK